MAQSRLVSLPAEHILIADGGSIIAGENVETALQEIATDINRLDVLTTRGDILYRNATVPARLQKGTTGQVLTQGANDPAWVTPSVLGANVILADANEYFDSDNVEAALEQMSPLVFTGFKGIAAAPPASGNYELNDKYWNTIPAPSGFIGWVCTDYGTMGVLNGAATTGSILTGTKALAVSALTGLAPYQYIDVATVTGPTRISSLPAALGSTTVDAESALGQKVLSVAATENFAVGETVCIGFSANCEVGVIATIEDGVSLTMEADLTKTHAIGETVKNCVVVDDNADATATAQAVSFHTAVWKGFGLIDA